MYPVSEIFYSTQGEGGQSGRAMIFVRLAGCTVGKRYPKEEYENILLPIWQNQCTIYDGRQFPCDTDYRKTETLSAAQIVDRCKQLAPDCDWVSITGGEPLMHDIAALCDVLHDNDYHLHLETSGTIPLKGIHLSEMFEYVVVSPKFPFLDEYVYEAAEIRILVGPGFQWFNLPKSIHEASSKVWISPVGEADALIPENMRRCVELQQYHPDVRISLQIHKLLKVR